MVLWDEKTVDGLDGIWVTNTTQKIQIKWWLELLGALQIMGETALKCLVPDDLNTDIVEY